MDSLNGKALLRASLIMVVLLVTVPAFAQVSIGIRIGPPPAPRVIAFRPVSPGPGIHWGTITNGMTDSGVARHILVLTGSHPITTENDSSPATGMENTVV